MPEMKVCSFAIFLSARTASMASSDDIVTSNTATIIVAFPSSLRKIRRILSGISSAGIDMSAMLSYHTILST